ncbi:recombinase family protein, partial [Klebsiella pneumoniae]|uniref:recombinase family protein n=1 Tax=Klebsiella pneumoniae TaxID=573 RepID=UPI003854A8C7
MQGHRIGYVRVSSFDQNPERQLEQTQVSKVFTDKASGKDTQRPQLEALCVSSHRYCNCLRTLKEGLPDVDAAYRCRLFWVLPSN